LAYWKCWRKLFYIINAHSGKVLDIDKSFIADGGNVVQNGLDNNNLNQQWQLIPVGSDTPINILPKKTAITKTTAPTSSGTCSEAIKKKGYKYCSENWFIVYTDEDGTWGVEDKKWCGCDTVDSCPISITSQGYRCCKEDNFSFVETDDSGKWDIENGHWCGISNNC